MSPYWELPRAGAQTLLEDEAQAITEFRALLADSVTDQMVSDVPIGAFLSAYYRYEDRIAQHDDGKPWNRKLDR